MSRRSSWSISLVVLAVVAGALPGCGDSGTNDKPSENATSKPANEQTDLNDLLSLPYTGGYPANEDDPSGVVFSEPERVNPGYRLYTTQMLSRADLIDVDGNVVHSWSHQPSGRWERAVLADNGDLIAVGADPSPAGEAQALGVIADEARYVLRLDWSGNVLWKQHLLAHHDVELLPDGRLLVLTFERRMLPQVSDKIKVRDDELTILRPDGTTFRSQSMLMAISRQPSAFPLQNVKPTSQNGVPWIDLFHSNSVQWLNSPELAQLNPIFAPGNVLVCFRHQNQIVIFDWDHWKAVWSWGRGELQGPHDAEVLPNGHILVFDNGVGRRASRGIEVDPLKGEIVWEYHGDPPKSFFTLSRGSIQRLPNGNTLLAESEKGRAIEVTPDREIVWEFLCPHRLKPEERAGIVRMDWYPAEKIDQIRAAQGK